MEHSDTGVYQDLLNKLKDFDLIEEEEDAAIVKEENVAAGVEECKNSVYGRIFTNQEIPLKFL